MENTIEVLNKIRDLVCDLINDTPITDTDTKLALYSVHHIVMNEIKIRSK